MNAPLSRAQLDLMEDELYALANKGAEDALARTFATYAKQLIRLEERGEFVDPAINPIPHNAAASTLVYVLARTGLAPRAPQIWHCASLLEGPPPAETDRLWDELCDAITCLT